MPRKRTIRLRNPQDPRRPFVRVEAKPGIHWSSCERSVRNPFGGPIEVSISPGGFYLDNLTLGILAAGPAIALAPFVGPIAGAIGAIFPLGSTLTPLGLTALPAVPSGALFGSAGLAQLIGLAGAVLAGTPLDKLFEIPGPEYVNFETPCDEHTGLY